MAQRQRCRRGRRKHIRTKNPKDESSGNLSGCTMYNPTCILYPRNQNIRKMQKQQPEISSWDTQNTATRVLGTFLPQTALCENAGGRNREGDREGGTRGSTSFGTMRKGGMQGKREGHSAGARRGVTSTETPQREKCRIPTSLPAACPTASSVCGTDHAHPDNGRSSGTLPHSPPSHPCRIDALI